MNDPTIKWDDVLAAYEKYASQPDEPDYIVLVDGLCPQCKTVWVTPFTHCLACDFPRNL